MNQDSFFSMPINVLITGIDSFTGKHLSSYMKTAGYNVYGTSFLKEENSIYKCDITQKEQIEDVLRKVKPEYLVHLSGISYAAYENIEEFYAVNTIGTTNILDAFLKLDLLPQKIVIASSATVYGNQCVPVLNESLCPQPANHYGASKYAMECLVKSYFSKLPINIVRPFNYTGIGQSDSFLIPKIVKHFKEKKKTIELGNLNIIREFNDVEFVCEAYTKLMETDIISEVVNLCSGRGIKLLDVIEMMNEIAGYTIDVKVNPLFVRKDEIKRLTGSEEKLFEMIGTIKQCDFSNTLKKMYEG